MTAIQRIPWPDTPPLPWKLTSMWVLPPKWYSTFGYEVDRVADDGLEYEAVCFRVNDTVVLLGRGVGGPENVWSFGTTRVDGPTGDELISLLGLRSRPYGEAQAT